jgi:glucan phosphoethanolaminetransferase (alkaline phosphatase superfamily)
MASREQHASVSDAPRLASWLRPVAGYRRYLRTVALLAPALAVVAFDVVRRGASVLRAGPSAMAAYAGSLVVSVAFWGVLTILVSRRSGPLRHVVALLAVVVATLALGGQAYFYGQYATYVNVDAALFATAFPGSVVRQGLADGGNLLHAHVVPLVVALALVVLARLVVRPRATETRWARRLAPVLLIAPLIVPCSFRTVQAAPPDVLFLHAVGGLALVRAGLREHHEVLPGARTPEYLPALGAAPKRPRNVVFLLNESVRADVVCSSYAATCPSMPRTNAALPGRIGLEQMRANDSATAVSVAVLMTGLAPSAKTEDLHRAPMIWEYARAAGWDTGYWTSQELRFAHSDMFVREIGIEHRVAAADLVAEPDFDLGADDLDLATYVERHAGELREPFLLVVQTANTHFPYLVDEAKTPFLPSEMTKDPEKNHDFYNYYRNSVVRQDEAVARIVTALRATPAGERTVIVYTSDHGEGFREHTQVGHGISVYDEEIHVPFFLDAPPGTLTDDERARVAALKNEPVFHVDILPTLIDLVGVVDLPEIARHRARFAGESLLGPRTNRAVPLTNCAGVWGCPFKNWGMMRGRRKLEARAWDPAWHCFDVIDDPDERRDLGAPACGDLADQAKLVFGGLPNGQ